MSDVAEVQMPLADRLVQVSERNYVLENAQMVAAAAAAAGRSPAVQKDTQRDKAWLQKADYGMTPQYLQKFKLDMAAQQAASQVRVHAMRPCARPI